MHISKVGPILQLPVLMVANQLSKAVGEIVARFKIPFCSSPSNRILTLLGEHLVLTRLWSYKKGSNVSDHAIQQSMCYWKKK